MSGSGLSLAHKLLTSKWISWGWIKKFDYWSHLWNAFVTSMSINFHSKTFPLILFIGPCSFDDFIVRETNEYWHLILWSKVDCFVTIITMNFVIINRLSLNWFCCLLISWVSCSVCLKIFSITVWNNGHLLWRSSHFRLSANQLKVPSQVSCWYLRWPLLGMIGSCSTLMII